MFAVIYRGYIQPEKERIYQSSWRALTQYYIDHCGALGSCLHKTDQGDWVAYSRWPDRKTRDAHWSTQQAKEHLPEAIKIEVALLLSCIDFKQPFSETGMDVIDDLLLSPATA